LGSQYNKFLYSVYKNVLKLYYIITVMLNIAVNFY